jgi:hypothetical protein
MEDICTIGDGYDRYWNWMPGCSTRSVTNKTAFATVFTCGFDDLLQRHGESMSRPFASLTHEGTVAHERSRSGRTASSGNLEKVARSEKPRGDRSRTVSLRAIRGQGEFGMAAENLFVS